MNRDINSSQKIEYDKITGALEGELTNEELELIGKGLKIAYHGATYLHYELRDKLNKEETLPKTKDEMDNLIKNDPDGDWIKLNPNEAQCHQYKKIEKIEEGESKLVDRENQLNTKYVNNLTGQEAVYNFETGELDLNPSIKGTYNYFTGRMPVSKDENGLKFNWNFEMTNASNGCINVNISDLTNGLVHVVCDLIPYYIGGNVR